jgi:hypothetical protein
MSGNDPLLIDLTGLVTTRAGDPKYRLLAQLVRRAYSMTSVRMDLHHALGMMSLVAEQQANMKEEAEDTGELGQSRALVASALFIAALLLYTRSVHSQGRGRNTLSLSGRLEPRFRAFHDRVIELRNQHFAHYASADMWEKWRVVAVMTDGNVAVSLPNDRHFLRASDASALHELLQAVQPLAAAAYESAAQRLIAEIYRLIGNGGDFADVASEFKFDPAAFFGEGELEGFYRSLAGATAFWHAPRYQASFGEGS